jgi:aspartyl-tRNA(Asn)/glutamyl-tRNA(Gln) amidotransferase subunit B
MEFVPVIGLEVHAQLLTKTKIFCGCSTEFGAPPNHQTCPVCLGMPGVLPVLNQQVVDLAMRAGLALQCELRPLSIWARKNYFYPDLPKGYQISMYELPICENGNVIIDGDQGEKCIRIKRIHLEEDAGKNIHETGGTSSLVDFNRAGVPLVEIVSEPDIGSSIEASEYLKSLRDILVTLGISNGNMEEGSFRCDANVSVMPKGSTVLGTRTELKNINSFRFVRQALDYEIKRQIELIHSGGKIVQETRLFDAAQGKTFSMRSKEEAHDYRYFPEPDLLPLKILESDLQRAQSSLVELPRDRLNRFKSQYGLSHEDAKVLTADVDRAVGEFFESVAAQYKDYKKIANWFKGELFRALKEGQAQMDSLKITSQGFAQLLTMVDGGEISGNVAKEVFAAILKEGGEPAVIVEARGLRQISDIVQTEKTVDEVLKQHPDEVSRYQGGKKQLLGFFTGQVMKAMKGKGNPAVVSGVIKKKLGD